MRARGRRFRALVNEKGWRIAMERHFPEVAAALAAAHAAAGAAQDEAPPAAEWRAAYKLLTHVPRAALHPSYDVGPDALESLRCPRDGVLTLAAWTAQRCTQEEEDARRWGEDDDADRAAQPPAAEAAPHIFWCACGPRVVPSVVWRACTTCLQL
jgi:hypothetical protein